VPLHWFCSGGMFLFKIFIPLVREVKVLSAIFLISLIAIGQVQVLGDPGRNWSDRRPIGM
jgi:hypothetical protein